MLEKISNLASLVLTNFNTNEGYELVVVTY